MSTFMRFPKNPPVLVRSFPGPPAMEAELGLPSEYIQKGLRGRNYFPKYIRIEEINSEQLVQIPVEATVECLFVSSYTV
jgi:hypothetical protein